MSDIFTSRNAFLIFHRFDHSSLQSLTLTVSHFTKFYNFLDNFDKWNKNLISLYFYDSFKGTQSLILNVNYFVAFAINVIIRKAHHSIKLQSCEVFESQRGDTTFQSVMNAKYSQ